jgi:hypothetical protein
MKTILSDGSAVVFNELTSKNFIEKTKGNTLENKITNRFFYDELSTQQLRRRNNGAKSFQSPAHHEMLVMLSMYCCNDLLGTTNHKR